MPNSVSLNGVSDENVLRGTVYDPRMGVKFSNERCPTCNENGRGCTGHFGHIEDLPYPFLNPFYTKNIFLQIMYCLCWACNEPLLENVEGMEFNEIYQACKAKKSGTSKDNANMRKISCQTESCDLYGKVQPFLHYIQGQGMGIVSTMTSDKVALKQFYRNSKAPPHDIKELSELYYHFNDIYTADPTYFSRHLNLPGDLNPADFIMFYIPVLPTSLRPHTFTNGVDMTHDFLTVVYNRIITILPQFTKNASKKEAMIKLQNEFNQYLYILYNSDPSNNNKSLDFKDCRGFRVRVSSAITTQIIKKRTDLSARTVIMSSGIDSRKGNFHIPNCITRVLGDTRKVTSENFRVILARASSEPVLEIMRPPMRGLHEPYNIVSDMNDKLVFKKLPRGGLKIGDFITFQLKKGDVLVLNRNPTLHKYGIIAQDIDTNGPSPQTNADSTTDASLCVSDRVWGISSSSEAKLSVQRLVKAILKLSTTCDRRLASRSSQSDSSISISRNLIDIHLGPEFLDSCDVLVDDNTLNDLRKWCMTDIPCIHVNSNIYERNSECEFVRIPQSPFEIERVIEMVLGNLAKTLSRKEQKKLLSEGLRLDEISLSASLGTLERSLAEILMFSELSMKILIPFPIRFEKLSPRQKDEQSCGIYRFNGRLLCKSISTFAMNGSPEEGYSIHIQTLFNGKEWFGLLKRSLR